MVRNCRLPVLSWLPTSTTLASENCGFLLSMQPLEKFLETSVRQDCFHSIERVSKLVMTPSLVNEILTRMARRHDLSSAFAARHHVMSSRRNFSFTEHTGLGHKDFVRSIANQYSIENGGRSGNRTVFSALARPYSAVEPHPLKMVSPAGLSPATWSLGHSRSVL